MVETTARQFVISSLIFTGLIAGLFALIGMSVPEGSGDFGDYNRTYNKFKDIAENANEISGKMEDAEPKTGIEGILNGMWDASFGAVKLIWTGASTTTTIITDTSRGGTPYKLPSWLTIMFTSIILVTIGFAIIASIRKWHI